MDNPFLTSIVRTVEQEIDRCGYTMVLHQISALDDEVRRAAILQREKKLLGVVFLGGRFNYTELELKQLDVPFVCCTYTNSFGDLSEDSYSSVSILDEEEACRAVQILIGLGHRQIAALIPAADDHSISQLRWQGYQKALQDCGLPYDPALVAFTGGYGMADAYRGVCALLADRPSFTALFTISDSMAIAAMKALSDQGLRVPEDCSVIAIDGLALSNYTIPTLTTLCQPAEELGRESVQMLVEQIEGTGPHRHRLLQTALREGGSTAAI